MTKYRYFLLVVAMAAMMQAGHAGASPLSDVFAPRSVPRLEYASLPVPLTAPMAKPAPAMETAPAPTPHEPTFWERLKSLFE